MKYKIITEPLASEVNSSSLTDDLRHRLHSYFFTNQNITVFDKLPAPTTVELGTVIIGCEENGPTSYNYSVYVRNNLNNSIEEWTQPVDSYTWVPGKENPTLPKDSEHDNSIKVNKTQENTVPANILSVDLDSTLIDEHGRLNKALVDIIRDYHNKSPEKPIFLTTARTFQRSVEIITGRPNGVEPYDLTIQAALDRLQAIIPGLQMIPNLPYLSGYDEENGMPFYETVFRVFETGLVTICKEATEAETFSQKINEELTRYTQNYLVPKNIINKADQISYILKKHPVATVVHFDDDKIEIDNINSIKNTTGIHYDVKQNCKNGTQPNPGRSLLELAEKTGFSGKVTAFLSNLQEISNPKTQFSNEPTKLLVELNKYEEIKAYIEATADQSETIQQKLRIFNNNLTNLNKLVNSVISKKITAQQLSDAFTAYKNNTITPNQLAKIIVVYAKAPGIKKSSEKLRVTSEMETLKAEAERYALHGEIQALDKEKLNNQENLRQTEFLLQTLLAEISQKHDDVRKNNVGSSNTETIRKEILKITCSIGVMLHFISLKKQEISWVTLASSSLNLKSSLVVEETLIRKETGVTCTTHDVEEASKKTIKEHLRIISEGTALVENRKENETKRTSSELAWFYTQKLALLKKELKIELHTTEKWKDALYGDTTTLQRDKHKQFLVQPSVSYRDLRRPIQDDRIVIMKGGNASVSGFSGTTFTSSDQRQITGITEIVDASYSVGDVDALGDGFGHYNGAESYREKEVGGTAYFANKNLARGANSIENPEALYKALPEIFKIAGAEAEQKARNPVTKRAAKEKTSGSVVKLFESNQGYKAVVGSVGDGMVLAWLPDSEELVVLAAARQYERINSGSGLTFNPISVTENLQGNMLQRQVVSLPENAIIVSMTDGAWESFPVESFPVEDPEVKTDFTPYNYGEEMNGETAPSLRYRDFSVRTEQMKKIFKEVKDKNPNATAREYNLTLKNKIIENTEEKREELRKCQVFIQAAITDFNSIQDKDHLIRILGEYTKNYLISILGEYNTLREETESSIIIDARIKLLSVSSFEENVVLNATDQKRLEKDGYSLEQSPLLTKDRRQRLLTLYQADKNQLSEKIRQRDEKLKELEKYGFNNRTNKEDITKTNCLTIDNLKTWLNKTGRMNEIAALDIYEKFRQSFSNNANFDSLPVTVLSQMVEEIFFGDDVTVITRWAEPKKFRHVRQFIDNQDQPNAQKLLDRACENLKPVELNAIFKILAEDDRYKAEELKAGQSKLYQFMLKREQKSIERHAFWSTALVSLLILPLPFSYFIYQRFKKVFTPPLASTDLVKITITKKELTEIKQQKKMLKAKNTFDSKQSPKQEECLLKLDTENNNENNNNNSSIKEDSKTVGKPSSYNAIFNSQGQLKHVILTENANKQDDNATIEVALFQDQKTRFSILQKAENPDQSENENSWAKLTKSRKQTVDDIMEHSSQKQIH